MTESTPPSPAPSRVRALLLDLDGTLVDSNYQHVAAWWEAFEEAGHQVSGYDVHRALGLPSAELVQQLLGRDDEAVVEGHARRWEAYRPRVQAFRGARELMAAAAGLGLRVVWATSGGPQDVEVFSGLLGTEHVHAIVGSADVERGKPDPQVVQQSLEAAGAGPDEALMVGDTTYDVRAARAAGVRSVGLLSGGIGRSELEEAGADTVLAGPGELAERLGALVA